jgi:hypothetical protein
VQAVRHLLHARLLESLFQDGQSFVERHAGLEEMAELLGENQQLGVRYFQLLRRWGQCCGYDRLGDRRRSTIFLILARGRRRAADQLDPHRHIMQLLDLPDGHGAVRAIEHSFH